MSPIKNQYAVSMENGATIILPPYLGGEEGWGNLAIPDPHVASAKQSYPRGTMLLKGDRSWVYTKLFTTTRTDLYGAYTAGLGLFSVAKPTTPTLVTGSAQLGESTVTVDAQTVNAFAGGLLTIFEAGQPVCIRGIISNTATVLTLDAPLPGTYTSSATARLVPSPYHDVVIAGPSHSAGAAFDYCPGIFNSPLDEDGNRAAINDFVWLQTWGLCNMWASGTYEGGVGGERVAIIEGDGAVNVLSNALIESMASFQRIGHLYPGFGDVTVGYNPDPADGTDPSMMENIIMLEIRRF